MSTPTHNDKASLPANQPTRRYYVFTDNGDWMEIHPAGAATAHVAEGNGVCFIALDAEDEDEFCARAEEGEGTVLARVSMSGAEVVLDTGSS